MHLSGWFTSSMAEFLGQAILLRPRRQPARVCAHCLSAPDFAVFPSSVTVLLLPQVILILCLQLNFWLHGVPSKAIVSWLGRCSWSHSVLNRSLLFHYIVRKTTASLKKKNKTKPWKPEAYVLTLGRYTFSCPSPLWHINEYICIAAGNEHQKQYDMLELSLVFESWVAILLFSDFSFSWFFDSFSLGFWKPWTGRKQ